MGKPVDRVSASTRSGRVNVRVHGEQKLNLSRPDARSLIKKSRISRRQRKEMLRQVNDPSQR